MMTCRYCGLEVPSDDAGRLFRSHLDCLKGAELTDPQRAWADMKDARRANGIDPVNQTELREDGWHNEVTPAIETMVDQLRYGR